MDANMPSATPTLRTYVYKTMASTLAQLHNVDVNAAGLHDYGSPKDYCRRQLKRWTQQYLASIRDVPQDVKQLVSWLNQNIPAEDATAK